MSTNTEGRCEDFEAQVLALARDAGGDDERLRAAAAHATTCARCGQRLAEERALGGALAALANADAGQGASAEVERRLLAHLRASGQRPRAHEPSRPPAFGRRLAPAAALVLGAAAFLWWGTRRPQNQGPAPGTRAADVGRIDEGPARRLLAPGDDHAGRTRPLHPGATPWTGFQPLGPLAWAQEARPGRVVRVTVPAALSVQLGWPVVPGAEARAVTADVLLGDDGVARAIRFLPALLERSRQAEGGSP